MENIEKKLGIYALADKEPESYGMICTSYDDKEVLDYYFNGFRDIYKSLDKYYTGDKLDTERKNFVEKVHSSYIYRIGYFDSIKGELENDKLLLVDLFDFNFESEESKK